MIKDSTIFVGLDLGDKTSEICILDEEGEVVEESRVPTITTGLKRRFSCLPSCRAAMEVGTHSRWASQPLKEMGHEVLVANARKLRLIYENAHKGDGADAEYLAWLVRLDPKLLSPIEHRRAEGQVDLTLIKSRDILVKARTKLINHVQGTVKSVGGRLPSCSAASFDKKVVDSIPEELRCALQPIVETIASLTSRIRDYDREIEKLCQERYPEAEHLQRVGGIGPVTSLAYILTLEDPGRFGKSREVGAYIGLVPKRDQSGERDPQLMITKEGDSYLRSLLVGSGQYILGPFGPDCDLRRWGLKLMERGGKNAKKRAVVAVARKLAVLLHRLWTTGEIYDPFYHAKREKEPAGVMKVSPCSAGEEEELELMLTGECSKG